MARMLAWALAAGALGMSSGALAAGPASATPFVPAKIQIEVGAIFIFAPNLLNPDGCSTSQVIAIPSTEPKWDSVLSMRMTSIAAGTPVNFYVSGCTSSPWYSSVPSVYSVVLQRAN